MSADNWRFCPRCFKNIHEDAAIKLRLARASYGVVPAEEYETLMRVARKPVAVPDTMREDYDLGIDENDDFYMRYKAHCDMCGFTYNHKLEKFNVFDGRKL